MTSKRASRRRSRATRPATSTGSTSSSRGLQTDAPLRRAIMPNGGLRMVEKGLAAYGYTLDPAVREIFTRYRKTHNDGVFDAYPAEVLAARRAHVITGLPDAYGRGRIIGDYRRVPLYGVDRLVASRPRRLPTPTPPPPRSSAIGRNSPSRFVRSANSWRWHDSDGHDVSLLVGLRTGGDPVAVPGLPRRDQGAERCRHVTGAHLDVRGHLPRARPARGPGGPSRKAQELIDDLVIKLRIVRFLRTPEYDELFSGDPTWVTESIGGMSRDGRPLVTRTSFRYLQTLYNLGPVLEPNLTVLWLPGAAGGVQAVLRAGLHRHQLDPIRVRRSDPVPVRGRHRDRLFLRHGSRQADAVLRARVNMAKTLLYASAGTRDAGRGPGRARAATADR